MTGESRESVDRLLAPATREEQISFAVRQALAQQAQHDAQAIASGGRLTVEDGKAQPAEKLQTLTLPNVYQHTAKEILFTDDMEAHLRKPSEPLSSFSQQLFFQRRQEKAFDRIADSIFPGFGRLEFNFLKRDIRLDYVNGRKCNGQKLGLCFSTTGR